MARDARAASPGRSNKALKLTARQQGFQAWVEESGWMLLARGSLSPALGASAPPRYKGVKMIIRCLSICFFIILLASSAFGQTINAKKLSRLRVSEDLRNRLAERLNLFIEYELSGQFEKQYDLLATNCPFNLKCDYTSREAYVAAKREERNRRGTIIELKLKGLDRKLKENCTFLYLDPKLRRGETVYSNLSSTIACLQNGDWYFGFWFVEI